MAAYRDYGDRLTQADLRQLQKRIISIAGEAKETAIAREKEAIDRLAAFVPDDSIPAELSAARANRLLRQVERASGTVRNISKEIVNRGAMRFGEEIRKSSLEAYKINLDYGRYSIDRQAGVFLPWPMLDDEQIRVIIFDEMPSFSKIAYTRLGQDRDTVKRLQSELVQAMLLGEGRPGIEKRIAKVVNMKANQAKRVAQTEIVRLQSQARFAAGFDAIEMGIDLDKQWISRMDAKVRMDHVGVTGEIVDYKKPFSNGLMFPGDPDGAAAQVINCRCVLKQMLKKVPLSMAQHREKMAQDYSFDEYRSTRGFNAYQAQFTRDINSLSEARTSKQVEDFMKKQGWFRKVYDRELVGDPTEQRYETRMIRDTNNEINITGTDLIGSKEIYKAYEQVFDRYPQLKEKFGPVEVKDLGITNFNVYGWCEYSTDGKVELNKFKYENTVKLPALFQNDVDQGYHPKGTDWTAIVTHELGHSIDGYLTFRLDDSDITEFGNHNFTGTGNKIHKGFSEYLIDSISKEMDITDKTDYKELISEYAIKNEKEFFAEGFMEFIKSDNPRPAAIEVGKQLDYWMGKVK